MTTLIKHLLIAAILIGTAPALFAQDKGVLEGRIVNGQNRPLASTTVTLVDVSGMTDSTVALTDSSGSFSIASIPYGQFNCTFTHAGYRPVTVNGIVFTPISGTLRLADITMAPTGSVFYKPQNVYPTEKK